MKGIIKKLNSEGGYGFITLEGKKDIFFHANDCTEGNFKDMHEGDAVSFETASSEKGPKAINVMMDSGEAANNNDNFVEEEASEDEQAAA